MLKNAVMLVVALIAAFIVYRMVIGLVMNLVGIAITIGVILFFGWLVVSLYKAMTKQKSVL